MDSFPITCDYNLLVTTGLFGWDNIGHVLCISAYNFKYKSMKLALANCSLLSEYDHNKRFSVNYTIIS